MTQEELAHAIDIHPTRVSHLESGRVNPRWGVVRRVAVALDVQLSDLARIAEKIERSRV